MKRGRRPPKCIRCGAQGKESFSICADGNVRRYVCVACDIALNALVLDFMKVPDAAHKIIDYIARKTVRKRLPLRSLR
jgi:hypothetical protein